MRIVQTFWTAGRDPLKHPFGWAHPEYNLMSWALSCLSLREHYDEVALYTDQEGYDVLINKLHLPYTEVNVIYDENLCLPHHWAYAKIKTYSMQTKPFLHVDGDVYLPQAIPEDVLNAPLIAQNREIGTCYYRSMIDRLLSYPEIFIPEYIQSGLATQSVASYNMGLFGGNDIDFIQRYCQEVENFMQINNMNDKSVRFSYINCNVFFEQILFAILIDNEQRTVTCLLENPIYDKGYKSNDFCSLDDFNQQRFFHLLGNHKKKLDITEMLCRRCLIKYPQFYDMVVGLFIDEHPRLSNDEEICVLTKTTDYPISEYIDFLNKSEQQWTKIDKDDLYIIEKRKSANKNIRPSDLKNYTKLAVQLHPYVMFFVVPRSWNETQIECLRAYLSCNDEKIPLRHICIIPLITPNIRRSCILQEMDMEILRYVKEGSSKIAEILDGLTHNKNSNQEEYCDYIITEIVKLIKNNILITI